MLTFSGYYQHSNCFGNHTFLPPIESSKQALPIWYILPFPSFCYLLGPKAAAEMVLCTARSISSLPRCTLFVASHIRSKQFQWQSSCSKISPSNINLSGLRYYSNFAPRSSLSGETSSGVSSYVKDEPDGVIAVEDTRPIENKDYGENVQTKAPEEDTAEENQILSFDFLDKIDIKFDSDDTYSTLLLGGVVLVSLYLATAIVGAIDSIPLFPKFMELIGISYTLWFSTRYLLFQENREELAAKIEEIKQQVLGSNNE